MCINRHYPLPNNISKTSYTGKAIAITTKIDSSKKDSSYTPPFEAYYKLDDYTGKIACPFPIKDEELTEIKRIISNITLEDTKLEKSKTIVLEMDSACIMVEQTLQILELL